MERGEFCSKLLLFGEYGVMLGSKALCLPLPLFSGSFAMPPSKPNAEQEQSNSWLGAFASFLEASSIGTKYNVPEFVADVRAGMYFASSIPTGYGIGSSGAVCAAFYSYYRKVMPDGIESLRVELAELESFFHGKSSGLDPLVSLTGRPIVISDGKLKPIEHFSNKDVGVFLIDTQTPRTSKDLISNTISFLNNPVNSPTKQSLIELTNRCIDTYMKGSSCLFSEAVNELSAFQLGYLNQLIPPSLIPIWGEGFIDSRFTLKLCGAGGGGFVLGFTTQMSETSKFLARKGITILPIS